MKTMWLLQIMFFIFICGCPQEPVRQNKGSSAKTEHSSRWLESRYLVELWPRLQQEGIESVTFCDVSASVSEMSSMYTGFSKNATRWRSEEDVKAWPVTFTVPQVSLSECIRLIDKAMRDAATNPGGYQLIPAERMFIITGKGKYIIWMETEITDSGESGVFAQDWGSYELGEFLKKCGYPTKDK